MRKMLRREVSTQPPARRDRRQRAHHEAPLRSQTMRDMQSVRAPFAAAPGNDVEVEDPRSPPPPAATAEFTLQALEYCKHFGWLHAAFDQRHRVGEIAASASISGIDQDRRCVEQAEPLVELRNGCLDDLRRPAIAAVRLVRADGDGIELRCA